MRGLPRMNRRRRRPHRAVWLTNAAVEMLEGRLMLSSAAVITWSMAPQIARNPDHGNQPDLPNTPAYVNPPDGFTVLLDASHSVGIQPRTTFSWTVTDSMGRSTPLSGVDPSIDLPQGPYIVKLTARGLRNSRRPRYATSDVQVTDVLIASIGDSYASGEGNPVVPGILYPEWAYSPEPAMNIENANAHRSTIAAPAQFALELQEENPHEAVTFVSVANSGASIPIGVLGPMPSIGDPSYELPPEITELEQITGGRPINVLTISVGANDIGFGALVKNLIENTHTGVPTLQTILSQFNASLQMLPQQYAELAAALPALHPGQVMITPYPDITRDQNGKVAEIKGPFNVTLVSKTNAEFASSQLIAPLDAAVAQAAARYHWTLVAGFLADFLTHGYPSTDSWIRSVGESLEMQGNLDGTFHPNAAGHRDIAKYLMAAYLADLSWAAHSLPERTGRGGGS
jgi:lysophospholipase L1-like esterase